MLGPSNHKHYTRGDTRNNFGNIHVDTRVDKRAKVWAKVGASQANLGQHKPTLSRFKYWQYLRIDIGPHKWYRRRAFTHTRTRE